MPTNPPNIADLIPRALADIVRANHEHCTIRLPSAAEVATLHRAIVADEAMVKGSISGWRLICFDRAPRLGGVIHVLLGFSETEQCDWSTSAVTALDLGMGLATTYSGSIYRLIGDRLSGEPSRHGLIQLCVMLTKWGWGRVLGVAPFFR